MQGAKFQCMPVPATSRAVIADDLFDQLWVARASHADVVRKDDRAFDVAVAVNGVDAVNQRDAKPRPERALLQRLGVRPPRFRRDIRQLGIAAAQNGAEEQRVDLGRVLQRRVIRLRHLADLFVERHPAEEILYAFLDRERTVSVGRLILLRLPWTPMIVAVTIITTAAAATPNRRECRFHDAGAPFS